jgi:hypothetical protein
MSIFNQMIRGGNEAYATSEPLSKSMNSLAKPRTFKETIQDQIAFHKSKVEDLEALVRSLTPEVEQFVEAIQRLG